ncbi:DUF5018-related domain-containing protein [Pedobacter foliorum]|uniref:DUF5018-related domain-containing protein n=1 Tax=Pedobacter foliorum TaxID=2739058 RepID=UPI001563DB3D|nr:hypothetical protein [Pedobacter foliorum]NRF39554.1 hypothetical protein [Pedobacter foliorum]
MKRQIKLNVALVATLIIIMLSSCLKKDLPVYPEFDANEITLVNIEYRFNGSQMMNGQPIVAYQKLTVAQTIDKTSSTINVVITVPSVGGEFTAEERAKVVQSKLWFYMNISTAAKISPVEGTPALGDPTDATKPLKYIVKAANGASKTWTVNVTALNK